MGTRGFYGFVKGTEVKGAYNHFDSYPDGLGVDVVDYIKTKSVDELTDLYNRLKMIKRGDVPTPEIIEKYRHFADTRVSTGQLTEWYVLLRNAQGDFTAYDKGLEHMEDGSNFPEDSLFCEWGYLINLNTNKLEILKGFNTDRDLEHPLFKVSDEEWAERLREKEDGEYFNKYVGSSLLTSFDLDKIPTNWVEIVYAISNEEEIPEPLFEVVDVNNQPNGEFVVTMENGKIIDMKPIDKDEFH